MANESEHSLANNEENVEGHVLEEMIGTQKCTCCTYIYSFDQKQCLTVRLSSHTSSLALANVAMLFPSGNLIVCIR